MSIVTELIASLLFIWVLIYIFTIYNGIICLHQQVEKAWSNLDVLLNQRHEEIPALVQVCRLYTEFERFFFIEAMCRKYQLAHTVPEKISIEESIENGTRRILSLSENHPVLLANETFIFLARRLRELEERISDQRVFYNDYVENYNKRISRFPDGMIAKCFGYQKAIYFSFRDKSAEVWDIRFPT